MVLEHLKHLHIRTDYGVEHRERVPIGKSIEVVFCHKGDYEIYRHPWKEDIVNVYLVPGSLRITDVEYPEEFNQLQGLVASLEILRSSNNKLGCASLEGEVIHILSAHFGKEKLRRMPDTTIKPELVG